MRIQRILILSSVAWTTLAATAFGATIPVGSSTGAAEYFPADPTTVDGGPYGAEISVAGEAGQTGSWTLSGGQTFSIGSGGQTPNAGPYILVGRGNSSSNGTITLTGTGTALSMVGDNAGATAQIGRQNGTGTLNVHDGATFSIYDPNSSSPDNDQSLHLGESGGTGTLDVDHSTVTIQTGNGAAIDVGANNPDDPLEAGTGIANITNNSSVTLRDLANDMPVDDEDWASFDVGQGDNTSGTVTVDHSSLTIDGQDSSAGIFVGDHAGSTAHMTIANGSTVNVTANSAGTAKGANSEADLEIGKGTGSTATFDISGGSTISMNAPYVYVGIGDQHEGSSGEMTISGGSTFSDSGAPSDVQIGQWNPATANGGAGRLTVSGTGTKFDVTGGIWVGQGAGAGSSSGTLKVESGGEVTADSVNLYRGGTLMGNGGTINADVNLEGGIVAPGASPGTMTINGDLNSNAGLVQIQIAGTDPSLYDHLIVNGDLNATTPLNIQVSFLNSFLPQIGDTFDFLQVLGVLNAPGDPFNVSIAGYKSSDFAILSSGGSFSFKTVALATTPIPAALPLFISALGGLGLVGWRRRQTVTKPA